jgi:uncharacterized protein (TIGR03085 family)
VLLRSLGPDAPTLCEGWATRHLAAHLVVRERQPLGAVGIVVRPLAHRHDEAIEATLARHSYDALVDRIEAGPPPWWCPIDALVNLVEFVVHHEDVRRGGPSWEPRPPAEVHRVDEAVWKLLRRGARLFGRRLHDVVMELRLPAPGDGEPDAQLRDSGSGSGPDGEFSGPPIGLGRRGPLVIAEGRPIELLLFLNGRQRAARVALDGPPVATAALQAASLGL